MVLGKILGISRLRRKIRCEIACCRESSGHVAVSCARRVVEVEDEILRVPQDLSRVNVAFGIRLLHQKQRQQTNTDYTDAHGSDG